MDWPSEVLPTPGGPTKHRIGAGLRIQLQHCQLLQDAVLDLGQVVVVLIEHRTCVGQVEVVVGRGLPGQLQHQLQIRARHLVIGGRGRQTLQPPQLALGFLAHVVGEHGFRKALAQGLHVGLFRRGFAKLVLNGAHLLAEHVIALLLADLGTCLVCDLVAQLQHLRLVVEILEQPLQGVGHGVRFKDRLFVRHVHAEHRGEQIHEVQRTGNLGQHLLEVALGLGLRELHHPAGLFDDGTVKRLNLRAALRRHREPLHLRLQEWLGLRERLDQHAVGALHEQLDGVLDMGHLLDDGSGADPVKVGQPGLVVTGIALGDDDEDLVLAGQGSFDGGARVGPADRQRQEHRRQQHRVLERQHGQRPGRFRREIFGAHPGASLRIRTSNMPWRNSLVTCARSRLSGNSIVRAKWLYDISNR